MRGTGRESDPGAVSYSEQCLRLAVLAVRSQGHGGTLSGPGICTSSSTGARPGVLAEHNREALAEHLGCSPDELRHGRTPWGAARQKPPPAGPHAAPTGYSAVPAIDVRAAAGPTPTSRPSAVPLTGLPASARGGVSDAAGGATRRAAHSAEHL